MNNAQGGYRIIDFNEVDLINEETPNTSIYKAIEESYKSKALLLSNIVIDKVEYNAVFKEIKHIDNYYTFEVYDRIIKVYADKIESISNMIEKTIDYNTLKDAEGTTANIKEIIISSQQSSRITITNIEEDKELYISLGYDKRGIYSYIISQPFSISIDETPQYNRELSIVTYDNDLVTGDKPFTDMQILYKNVTNSTGKIVIDVNKINNTFVINIVNAMAL